MRYWFFTIHKTPKRAEASKEFVLETLNKHTAYFKELGKQDKCLFAGPFVDQTTDMGGGIYSFQCETEDEARRLAERGVRFTQIFIRQWDQHGNLPRDIRRQCGIIDQPCYALVQDLKQRGLLEDTLVIWGGEFGRTIYCQGGLTKANYGRDNTVFQTTTGAKYEITDLLYFNIEALFDYESEPVDGAENEDLKLLVGFGLEFD